MTVELWSKTAKIWRRFTKGSKKIQMGRRKEIIKLKIGYITFETETGKPENVSDEKDVTVLENRSYREGDFSDSICSTTG